MTFLDAGHKACKLIIEDGLKMSEGMSGHRRSEMLQLCKEAESLSNLLEDFCRNGQVSYCNGNWMKFMPSKNV